MLTVAGSIHLNGKKLADAGAGLEKHIEKEDSVELLKNISKDLDRRSTTSRGRGSNTRGNDYDRGF